MNLNLDIGTQHRINKLTAALELVLLFHSGHWTKEAELAWNSRMDGILGEVKDRPEESRRMGNDASTRNLCNAVRAALKA